MSHLVAADSLHPVNEQDGSPDLSRIMVLLLKGVLYQDADKKSWAALLTLQNRVRDYISVLGLELILDEAEGYAFLKTRLEDEIDGAEKQDEIPRLIARRQLSFPVSLLLALLRKKMAEFDSVGGDTRLVLGRDDIVELIRLFLPDSSNEAKLVDQVDRHINKVVELGFLRKLNVSATSTADITKEASYEVRRIIKSFVDAQWLSEFDSKLESYRQKLFDNSESKE